MALEERLDRLEMEHENITAALEWSGTESECAEAGLRLAAALRWFWFVRTLLQLSRAPATLTKLSRCCGRH